MNLVVDTSVWSLLLRRRQNGHDHIMVKKLRGYLERQDCIFVMGPILQEILDGVRYEEQFKKLLKYFSVFPLVDLGREDYVAASRLRNLCRSKGIQAGTVDFLIAAACIGRNYPLLTGDRDFKMIAEHSGLVLL